MKNAAKSAVKAGLKKLVVLISGRGSNMEALLAAKAAGWLAAEFTVVISNRADAQGLATARASGIAVHAVSHRDYSSREAFDTALIEVIDSYQPDLVVLAGFMRILTPDFVRHYDGRLLNIHPSLLPAFPGLDTHQRALAAGCKIHGATVHFVTPELDHGPIVIQAAVPVLATDDAASLAARVLAQEHGIYPRAVRWFVEGRLTVQNGIVHVGQGNNALGAAADDVTRATIIPAANPAKNSRASPRAPQFVFSDA